jgi:hypothetical protein
MTYTPIQSKLPYLQVPSCYHTEHEFGHYTAQISQMSREDAISLANLLRQSDNNFLRKFGIEIESELMEVE